MQSMKLSWQEMFEPDVGTHTKAKPKVHNTTATEASQGVLSGIKRWPICPRGPAAVLFRSDDNARRRDPEKSSFSNPL